MDGLTKSVAFEYTDIVGVCKISLGLIFTVNAQFLHISGLQSVGFDINRRLALVVGQSICLCCCFWYCCKEKG